MTEQEIRKEMQECSARIRQLADEVGRETDFSVAKAKIDEMLKLADRQSELDSMNKKLLITKLQQSYDKMLSDIKKALKLS